jgi:hypothetical protein
MKPCERKRASKTLRDALFEMQVDGVFSEDARVLEDDRPDRGLPAPVGELLVLLPGRTKRIEGGGPARVRAPRGPSFRCRGEAPTADCRFSSLRL